MAAPAFGKPISDEPPLERELDVLCPRAPKEVVPFSGDLLAAQDEVLLYAKAATMAALLTYVGEHKLRFESCIVEGSVDDGTTVLDVRVKLRPASIEELEAENKDTEEAVDAFVKTRLDELWEEEERKDGDAKKDEAVAAYKATCDVEVASIEHLASMGTEAARREAFVRAKNLEAAIKQRCDSLPWFKAKFEALVPARLLEVADCPEPSFFEGAAGGAGGAAGGAASGCA
jgi:hypothetical protein